MMKSSMMKYFGIAFLVVLIIVGCKENAEDKGMVYASVNGKPFTAEMVSNHVMVAARFLEHSKRPVKSKVFPVWANNRAAKLLPSMISGFVFESELQRKGFAPTSQSDAAVLERYNKRAKMKAATIDDFVEKFGADKTTLRDMIRRDSIIEAFYSSNNRCDVTDADVAAYLASVSNQVSELTKYNESTVKKGRKVWQKLKGGASWESVADEYSEDRFEGGDNVGYSKEWETFTPQYFYLKEVGAAVVGLKKGDITEPLDTDEGLLIVKVNDVNDDQYTCSRILLRMAIIPPIPDAEKARARIRLDKCMALQEKVLSEVWKNQKIEYPLGTNFTIRLWSTGHLKGKKLKNGKTFVPVQM